MELWIIIQLIHVLGSSSNDTLRYGNEVGHTCRCISYGKMRHFQVDMVAYVWSYNGFSLLKLQRCENYYALTDIIYYRITVYPWNIYIYTMYFQNGKHLWTYHGMVDDPMCASFKAFLLCHQMPLSIPAVGVQQELFQAQPSFWTIENGDVYWCCLMFPINVGRTNIYIYVYIHIHTYVAAFICFYMRTWRFPWFISGIMRDGDICRFASKCKKNWLMCQVPCFKCDVAEVSRPSPWTTSMMQCYMWQRLNVKP